MKDTLKMALEALEDRSSLMKWQEARDAVKEALAQPEQKPVAWRAPNWGHGDDEWVYRDFDDPVLIAHGRPSPNNEPLYTTPPQRTWVGLTDEDLANCDDTELKQALYWEQILKEKNT